MQEQQQTYTQVMGENGEIKYVPVNPPPPPPKGGGSGHEEPQDLNTDLDEDSLKQINELIRGANLAHDDKLTEVLTTLTENNKKLRFNKRLQSGKLDGRRLTAFKTSDRLFKLKAIKDKQYQFTFLVDTSGSMWGDFDGDDESDNPKRIQMALESVARTVKSLEDMNLRSSVFGMNNSFRMFKSFNEKLDDEQLYNGTFAAMVEKYSYEGREVNCASGTSEWVAYTQVTDYIARNSTPKITNVVIVISDGEPGGRGGYTQVIIDGEETFVENNGDDRIESLAKFWERHPEILAFGLGIGQKARQVPTNKQIDDISKLPEVMGNLLTELML